MRLLIAGACASLLGGLLLSACSSTTLSGSWSDPNFSEQVKKVYIVGLVNHETTRRIFEDEFVRQLSSFGVSGLPSYPDLSKGAEIDKQKIAANIASNGADALLMTYISGRRTEQVVNPGRVTTIDSGPSSIRHRDMHSRHYRGYFDRHREVIFEPATISEFEVVTIDASLYSSQSGELIWSAQLETVLGSDVNTLLTDFVRTVVQDLRRNELI